MPTSVSSKTRLEEMKLKYNDDISDGIGTYNNNNSMCDRVFH